MSVARHLIDGGVEVVADLFGGRAMLHVEGEELAENVVALSAAFMADEFAAGDDDVGESAEHFGDLDAHPARIFAGAAPEIGVGFEVVVAVDEVVGGLQEDGAQASIAAA